jgi:DNA-binding IscR family transcriptional regulator
LEPVLQALVHEGILRGIRGPRGGYELGREAARITADDILKAAGNIEEGGDPHLPGSILVGEVVVPAVAQAERAFSAALAKINLDEMVQKATPYRDARASV